MYDIGTEVTHTMKRLHVTPVEQRRFVAYYRVSTTAQGSSGLGIEAQRAAVSRFLGASSGILLQEFCEVETGKGADAMDRRPELRNALSHCKREKATLLIAKLDRLARNAHFVTGLIESGADFIAADMPNAEKLQLQIFAAMAEWERDQISARTKAALVAAKARGVVLGRAGKANLRRANQARQAASSAFCEVLRIEVAKLQRAGLSQREIVNALNVRGLAAPRGGAWSLVQVQRLLRQLDGSSEGRGVNSPEC